MSINIKKKALNVKNGDTYDNFDMFFLGDVGEAVDDWFEEHPDGAVPDGSLTLEKFKNGELPFVTPEMFGAVGDGITDDTEAIQTAFTSGYNVIFYSGANYIITNPINVDGGQQKIGLTYNGNGCTITHNESNGFCVSSEIGGGLKQCLITGFNFETTNKQYDSIFVKGGVSYAGSNYLQECEITRCKFTGSKYGIYLGGYRVTVSLCYFTNCDYGINDDSCNNALFINNYFIGNNRGLQFSIPYFSIAINNTFHANTYGIFVTGKENDQIGAKIIGNTFRAGTQTVTRHIIITGTSDVIISNNFFGPNATQCVESIDSDNIFLNDNYCLGVVFLHATGTYGKNMIIDGGFYNEIIVGTAQNDVVMRNVISTLIQTNATTFPRTDRYIVLENAKLVVNSGGTNGRITDSLITRLKTANVETPTNQYNFKTIGTKTYSLQEDTTNNVLTWELVS